MVPKRPVTCMWLPKIRMDKNKLFKTVGLQNLRIPVDYWMVIKEEEPPVLARKGGLPSLIQSNWAWTWIQSTSQRKCWRGRKLTVPRGLTITLADYVECSDDKSASPEMQLSYSSSLSSRGKIGRHINTTALYWKRLNYKTAPNCILQFLSHYKEH